MTEKRVGQRTIALAHPPSVISFANIGGRFEGEGPLGGYFVIKLDKLIYVSL